MSFHPEPRSHDDLQSEQIAALLQGQHQLAEQMAEIVLAHQAIVRRHDEDQPRIERIEATLAATTKTMTEVRDMVALFTALSGAKTVLGWAGKAALWVGGLVGVWMALRAAVGDWPKP